LSLLLSACWPAPGFDAGRTGHNPFEDRISRDTVDDLHQIWTAVTDGGDVAGPAEEPVVSNQAVHVSAGRALYALSKSTGARLWQKVTDAPSPVGVMGQAVADGDRVLVGHGFPNLGGNWVTEAVDAATGAPLAEVGAGLVDGLRGSTLLTRRQGFGTGTPVAISLTVTDLDQPGSGRSGTIGVVAPLGASPSRRHSPLARTSPSTLATGLSSSLVVH
jgi:outer membrane protein assembly factor BamB